MISLENKVTLITGASRGIGAATARLFAEAGARAVVVNYHKNREAAERVVADCERLGAEAVAARADVSKVGAVRTMVGRAVERFGQLDVVVANAGIWKGAAIQDMTEREWDEMMDTNMKSTYATCSAAAQHMLAQRGGAIVIVSSTAGQRGEAFHSHYAATKGAQISFTKALSSELAPRGVRVNCVAPGWVDTELNDEIFAKRGERRKAEEGIPVGRIATAEDIAGPILFLASDLARHVTGEILNVNGGSVLCG